MRRPAPLSRTDWIKAGFRALVAHGAGGFRLEPLIADLGATKGSFYWHFEHLADLRMAMLETWETLATRDLSRFVRDNARPEDRLRLLVELVAVRPAEDFGGVAAEPALRDWARHDPAAAEVLARVDRQRLADLAEWCAAAGLSPDWSLPLYAQIIGLMTLRPSSDLDMAGQLHRWLDLLLTPPSAPDRTDSA
jgi:AcrR family transcriptional regulator